MTMSGTKLNRSEVYALIDGERDYQDKVWPVEAYGKGNGVSASPEGFLLIIEKFLSDARTAWVTTPLPKDSEAAMSFIRKIGGTAVRAMEQHGASAR
jgi:hypothetical protein